MQLCGTSPDGTGGVARSITKVRRMCRTSDVCGRRGYWKGGRPTCCHRRRLHPVQRLPEDGDHPRDDGEREPLEPLFASLSAAISAIEAAHSQFRLAHSSVDTDAVRSAAQIVFSQLSHVSLLECSYRKRPRRRAGLETQVREQRDRLKDLHLETKRLQYELRDRDEEVGGLRATLSEVEARNAAMEAELRPSDMGASYFHAALRYALTAVRRFVALMARHMMQSRWDLDAAAGALQPEVLRVGRRPEHRTLAFMSLVCRAMFTGFHHPDFGVARRAPPRLDGSRAFAEFLALKAATAREVLVGGCGEEEGRLFGEFCRRTYLGLVEAKMETSFFGNLEQREMVDARRGFPKTEFFEGFAEMARRVWLLHRLAEAFADKGQRLSIFQVRKGRLFSAAYMEEVGGDAAGREGESDAAVGFTVVPGFRVGEAVIRAKVFVTRAKGPADGRP
ncbi:hypothetical protein Taro_007017 [Colocasia esculenta]|uniref:DUF641 domain-containing protein n=1 Tax=Colocasia esculenta TaxID=4460 RepID=A0A843TUA3_COLES|nr:hypothetical protein [Colocasia esculenta]